MTLTERQQVALIDEVLERLDDEPLERAEAMLDAAVLTAGRTLGLAPTADEARAIAALAYEQLAASAD